MIMRYLFLFLFISILALTSAARAGMLSSDAAQAVFGYPMSVAGMGMGGMSTFLEGDTTGLFDNPASNFGSRAAILGGRDLANLDLAQSYTGDFGAIGVAYRNLGLKSLPQPGGTNSNLSGSNIILGYAFQIKNWKTSLGINLRKTDISFGVAGTGSDLSLGVVSHPLNWLAVGGYAQNILVAGNSFGVIKSSGGYDAIPGRLLLGAKINILALRRKALIKKYGEWNLALELEGRPGDSNFPLLWRVGVEWKRDKLLALRLGENQESDGRGSFGQLTAGFSLNFDDFGFNYAYFPSSVTRHESSHYFSAGLNYLPEEGLPEEYKKKSIRADVLELLYPPQDFETYDEKVEVSGKLLEKVSLQVNDREVMVNPDLSFSADIPLKTGKNYIEVVATQGDDEVMVSRSVLRRVRVVLAKGTTLTKSEVKKVENLATLGVVEITPTGFNPEEKVCRGELASWLVRARGIKPVPLAADPFPDVPKTDKFAAYIKVAAEAGWLPVYADGKFHPEALVSEEEAKGAFQRFDSAK